MKKIIVALIVLFVLCGCSSSGAVSKVSDGDAVMFADPKGNAYTKQDNYESILKNDITSILTNTLKIKLAVLEGIDVESIKADAQEYIDELIDQGYAQFITYYYGSAEAYVNDSSAYEAFNQIKKNMIENDFETYVNDYNPYKASIVYFDSKEQAEKALESYNNGSTFAYACTENGYSSEVSETVYSDKDSDLPVEIKDYILNTEEIGVSDVIEVETVTTDSEGTSSSASRFYIVNLISKDVESFKDDFISVVSADLDDDTILINLLNKYEINIYDQSVYEILTSSYEVLK